MRGLVGCGKVRVMAVQWQVAVTVGGALLGGVLGIEDSGGVVVIFDVDFED